LHFTLCIGSLVSCLPVRVLICAPTWKSTCCSFQRENLQSSVFFHVELCNSYLGRKRKKDCNGPMALHALVDWY
jgi:hypothetical protein